MLSTKKKTVLKTAIENDHVKKATQFSFQTNTYTLVSIHIAKEFKKINALEGILSDI